VTAATLAALIGKTATYSPKPTALMFDVKIVDAKSAYGRPLVKIADAYGCTAWVELASVAVQ
jgi:hypothetical protein